LTSKKTDIIIVGKCPGHFIVKGWFILQVQICPARPGGTQRLILCARGGEVVETMTISDAVDAFSLFDLYSEILDSYGEEFDTQSSVASDLYDLISEHEDEYEFSPDSEGDYAESFERNLKEAVSIIFEEHGLDGDFDIEFSTDAMDDDEISGIYIEGYKERPGLKEQHFDESDESDAFDEFDDEDETD
jgi:hypothetical protein